jgi:hypothetical protein
MGGSRCNDGTDMDILKLPHCDNRKDGCCTILNRLTGRSITLAGEICIHCTSSHKPRQRNEVIDSVVSLFDEPKPKEPWPLFIVGISRQRIPSDTGVGDTVERILSRMGGDQFKWVMARLGVDCGCGSRQEWLNRVYPYE